jgi:hypothetical protein
MSTKQYIEEDPPPPIAVATVISSNDTREQQYNIPVVVQSIPMNQQQYITPIAEPAPICRGCGQVFIRAQGVHSGMAQYFRCDDCSRTTIDNFCVIQ